MDGIRQGSFCALDDDYFDQIPTVGYLLRSRYGLFTFPPPVIG
jgi:hypothetical protein